MTFQVLQYNVFGRPNEVSKDGQAERLARVPASLLAISKDIDVVTFAEADVQGEREAMLDAFQHLGFPYSTTILHDPNPFTSLINGGVLVVSKWPIVREAQHIYRHACHYSDCLAAKGVKYARVVKTVDNTIKVFNVFATHMQAWSTPQGRGDRVLQAQQMREFVDAMQIPHHEPLIFAGDFNVDNTTYKDEVQHLVDLLGAHMPKREWLDYVLWAKSPYQQPMNSPTLESRVNQVAPFIVDWSAPKDNMRMQLTDISDHYPVLSTFEFAVNNSPGHDNDPNSVHLDGCSTDDDCRFRNFRCYCRGPNCYFQGKRTDGWDLDSQHPVNRNCLYQKSSFKCLCGPN
ncbi:hypothetical protein P43SY_004603 [Pythium insidiosum]|uniref:sphingomyelin phosphodiesterase n=1 Tax=Pythium insidiosum TaxID=114742 RepID=A0AAD5MC53_PYTIN|nr:hypothetical protein P43SY_004603 [Pythium insidiosum]